MSEKEKIAPNEKLLRWLHPSQFDWKEKRPTSAAFKDPYMSVDIYSLTTLDESYERAIGYGKNAVASLTADLAYEKEQQICHCPTSLDRTNLKTIICITDSQCKNYRKDVTSEDLEVINLAHACVIGKKSKSIAKFFAQNAEVEIYPPQSSDD